MSIVPPRLSPTSSNNAPTMSRCKGWISAEKRALLLDSCTVHVVPVFSSKQLVLSRKPGDWKSKAESCSADNMLNGFSWKVGIRMKFIINVVFEFSLCWINFVSMFQSRVPICEKNVKNRARVNDSDQEQFWTNNPLFIFKRTMLIRDTNNAHRGHQPLNLISLYWSWLKGNIQYVKWIFKWKMSFFRSNSLDRLLPGQSWSHHSFLVLGRYDVSFQRSCHGGKGSGNVKKNERIARMFWNPISHLIWAGQLFVFVFKKSPCEGMRHYEIHSMYNNLRVFDVVSVSIFFERGPAREASSLASARGLS